MIKRYKQFLEGIYFKDDFTPLYHYTRDLKSILLSDKLISLEKSRGPSGISFSRSKDFDHIIGGSNCGSTDRLILNYDKLKIDGYRSYPVDEWALNRAIYNKKNRRENWYNRKMPSDIHFGKSNIDNIKNGKRGISHNINSLPSKDKCELEIEFEERILKDINKLHKYLYAINFTNEESYLDFKKNNGDILEFYLKMYPNVKLLIGKTSFKELQNIT